MKVTNEFLIPFIGLKLGKHQFEYAISKTFFDDFSYHEFSSCNIKVNLVLEKQSTMLELNFKHSGTVNVPCDVTNNDFDLPIKGSLKLIVRFGEVYNDENEELLILPFGEHQIDVTQYIYEMIVLSIPLKRVSPSATKSKSKTLVAEDKTNDKETQESEQETDPRWDKLKKLLTDK